MLFVTVWWQVPIVHLFTIPLQPVSVDLVPIIIPKLDQNNKHLGIWQYVGFQVLVLQVHPKKNLWAMTLVVAESPHFGLLHCCLVTALGASRPRFSNKPSWGVHGNGWMVPENKGFTGFMKKQLSMGKTCGKCSGLTPPLVAVVFFGFWWGKFNRIHHLVAGWRVISIYYQAFISHVPCGNRQRNQWQWEHPELDRHLNEKIRWKW